MSAFNTAQKIKNGQKANIVFIGDSITQGHYELDKHKTVYLRSDEVYHQIFKHKLEQQYPNSCVYTLNAGVNGQTAQKGLARMQSEVLDISVDMCVVCFGLNDVFLSKKHIYTQSLGKIFSKLKQNNIECILLTPCSLTTEKFEDWGFLYKLSSITASKKMKKGIMDQYIQEARQTAKQYNIAIADGYAKWQQLQQEGIDTNAMLANGINHPNKQGHQILADVLYDRFIQE